MVSEPSVFELSRFDCTWKTFFEMASIPEIHQVDLTSSFNMHARRVKH